MLSRFKIVVLDLLPRKISWKNHPVLATQVAEGLYDMLVKLGAQEDTDTLGGDSYNGNTGRKGDIRSYLLRNNKYPGGTNAHLERMLCHKCNWLVCACHTNELPLRHLIEKIGKTSQNLILIYLYSS